MDRSVFEQLLQQQLISETEFQKVQREEGEPLSLHWDLRTLLYLSISLLAAALGILIYKNIETIGHNVILAGIAAACAVCFIYCFRKWKGYSPYKVTSSNLFFDYVLLLGCLLLLTFIGYLQYAYNLFGNRWGLALFIPMVLLFITAYLFDHLGILSLAITNLAAWAGIAITPLQVLKDNDFTNVRTIYTGLLLGGGLIALSFLSVQQRIKAHFGFTYKNFGSHILFISLLAGLFHFNDVYLLWAVVLAIACFFIFNQAVKERSFYFLVITVLYGWIGLSYVMIRIIISTDAEAGILYLGIFYFIFSGIGLIRLLMHYNKKLKYDAHL